MDADAARRHKIDPYCLRFGLGDCFRDWETLELPCVVYPYVSIGGPAIEPLPTQLLVWLWHRSQLARCRTVFGKTMEDNKKQWYEHLEHYVSKLRTPLSIAFAFVATHNHFVLDRGGKVFNRSAPIIKLPAEATEDDHLALLGVLNSSTTCFWMKQVCYSKGAGGINEGVKSEHWEQFREFAGAILEKCPLPRESPIELCMILDLLGREHALILPEVRMKSELPTAETLAESSELSGSVRRRMIALQEELDWQCYHLYGLLDDDLRYDGRRSPRTRAG